MSRAIERMILDAVAATEDIAMVPRAYAGTGSQMSSSFALFASALN